MSISTTKRRLAALVIGLAGLFPVAAIVAPAAQAHKAPAPVLRATHLRTTSSATKARPFKFSVALGSARIADATTSDGICVQGWQGSNPDLGHAMADFESPQRGTPRAQVNWIAVARVGSGHTIFNNIVPGASSVGTGGGKTYCSVTSHWDKAALGTGEDYAVISYVVYWNYLGGSTYQPVAYGSYNGLSYWRADSNGATAQFNVAMPPDGHPSNWTAPTP